MRVPSLCTTDIHNSTEQLWLSFVLSSRQAPELRCCLLEGRRTILKI